MRTYYSENDAEKSNIAHTLARKIIYPKIFNVPQKSLVFEDTLLSIGSREAALDGELAIDRVVGVSVDGYRQPIKFTIQERFRDPQYQKMQDVTITEWNCSTQQPSELYKMAATMFVYGYWNKDITDFLEVVAFFTAPVWMAIVNGEIKPSRGNNGHPKNQDFIAVSFNDLYRTGAICYHYPKHGPTVSILDVINGEARTRSNIQKLMHDISSWIMSSPD